MLLDITTRSFGMGESEASFDLENQGRLNLRVTHQGQRFYRASLIWLPTGHDPVHVLRAAYLDGREHGIINALEVSKRSDRRMWAHTIHGSDMRHLLNEGAIKW